MRDGITALVVLVVAGASVAYAYGLGRQHEAAAHAAADAAARAAAAEQLREEAERGQAAAAGLNRNLLALQDRHIRLEETYRDLRRRVPVVVHRAVRPVGRGRCAGGAPDGADRALGNAAPAAAQQPADERGDRLSRMAVWLWNSSLAGRDVPSGACGAAGAPEAACAADSGLTVEDALANHIANARLCSEDRERHQQLVDHLTEQQTRLRPRQERRP